MEITSTSVKASVSDASRSFVTPTNSTTTSKEGTGAKLAAGQYALDFEAIDAEGNNFKLSDFKGKKILLSFYRNVSCPFCNRQVHKLMTRSLQLKKSGLEIVFIFESSNEKLTNSAFHQGILPWPLIGNPEKDIYHKYKIEESTYKTLKTFISSNPFKARRDVKDFNLPEDKGATQNLIPADFLIDENFKICKAHYGDHMDDHIDFEEIKKFAQLAY